MNGGDTIYLISKELDAHYIICVGECEIYRVAFHAEAPARQFHIIAYVLRSDELLEQIIHRYHISAVQLNSIIAKILRAT